MAILNNVAPPAAKPTIFEAPVDWMHPGDPYRMHWYGEPGHQCDADAWTPVQQLGWKLDELTVHWSEENTPAGKSDDYYQQVLANEAHYHAFDRNWGTAARPIVGDTIMYHYAVTPPNGFGISRIIQLTAETRRTWNARAANSHNLAVMLMAGHGDKPSDEMISKLYALLDWLTTGRADLPLLTPAPLQVRALSPSGPTVLRTTRGVLTHDESLMAQGQPVKGCCGIYKAAVAQWRANWDKLLHGVAA
jgi:hypothetical protein